ncbi:TerC family protein [Nakamurella sp. A5-74]|uniref:TerC family protein n=1 Tax=Nakamurella sp. A5-74 TaxID=3158264 RepID=A0AAU8DPE3_9ACTN
MGPRFTPRLPSPDPARGPGGGGGLSTGEPGNLDDTSFVLTVVDFFSSPDLWVAFLTLFALELVLGIDNVVFISILTQRLPQELQRKARIIGLSLAMIMRIGLLFAASWIIGLTDAWFSIGSADSLQFSGRDLILIVGGLFLVYKAVTEIHQKLEGTEHSSGSKGGTATFGAVIVQIILIDAVFSLDSVITAVGMVDELYIMIAAVVLSIGLMMVLAGRISGFVDKHPTVKMLALSFLVLIGASLIAEGFDAHVNKALIYGPIAFAIAVEALNLSYRNRQAKRNHAAAGEPVHLHPAPREPDGTPIAGQDSTRTR